MIEDASLTLVTNIEMYHYPDYDLQFVNMNILRFFNIEDFDF